MRRLLLIVAGTLIFLAVAVPAAGLYYLTFTESGFRFLVNRIPRRVGEVQLELADPSGTIAHGVRLGRLEVDHHLVHLRFDGIQGRVELLPLLLQTIRTRDGSVDRISIQIKRRTRPPSRSAPFFLPRWLVVSAERAHVGSAVLTLPSGTRLEASDIHASGIARHRSIRFFEAGLQSADAHIEATGQLKAADPLQIDANGRITWTQEGQPAWSVATIAKGDLNVLSLTAHTVTPFRSDFTGEALDLTGHWHWLGNALVHDLDVTAWGGSPVLGLLSGQLALKGDQDGFAAQGPVRSSGLKAGLFDTQFEGAYSQHVLSARHMDIVNRDSHAHVMGHGTITVVRNGPALDLQGKWQDFRWPLTGRDVAFRSASGQFTVSGTWPYKVHLAGSAAAQSLPPMPASVEGTLARDRFSFSSAELDLSDGHASLSGAVVWAPVQSWAVSGRATDINPARFRADLPGKLSFALNAEGRGFGERNDFAVEIRDLSGRLRGVTASGGGKFSRRGAAWQFDNVRVALGRTHLALDGSVNHVFDVKFGLSAQDLSLVSAESRGELEASGTLRGTLKEPIIAATAHGRSIHHEGLALDDFDLAVDFDPTPQHQSKIAARLHNLVFRDRKLDELTFKLDGTTSNYAVRLEAQALGLSASARASGPLVNTAWQGQLDALTVTGTESLHLELDRPVDLLVSADALRADWLCLVGQPASLCAEAEWSASQWKATFTANELPLATLTAGVTQAVDYGGRINLHAHVFGAGEEPPEGTMRLDLIDAQLAHRLSSGRIDHTKIGSGVIEINASRAAVHADIGLESGDIGTIKGAMDIQRNAEDWQKMPVKGELHAHTDQLDLVTLYVPEIDRAAGHLDADMQIAGTLGTPFVNGTLKISEGEIDYYQVNLGMRQVAFDARLTDNGVDFSGSTRMGSGIAKAKGRLEWRDSLPYGKVELEGTDLRVVDVPEAHIDAAPKLQFSINGRKIDVAGAVNVPYAKIVPKDLSGAVRSSDDEVIVGEKQADPSKRFEVTSTITLGLGDHVSIDTTGLTGRLTGNITVRSGYEPVTSATGELSIEQGKYTAYARKLDIQRGRLIFTGGPIGNPGIDIRAIKEFPDVTAGVNVRGTLLQPRMSFFSDPSLTQAQIVSLILAGGSLETAQTRQTGAGSELLAQGGAILAQQLGSRVGIEDVSLESDLTNETSLVLGRYLSPRLYVSYGIALTEQLNVLKLRYSLGNRWTVKTEVGQARGADLVYTIER
ncbi:MAG TPA: translocation/assembly module TamB domain-containing protein [Steroidobacteraceae bacterium]|nr:translocation/assembly module TamB domain-containing protein [Steroidobacteraceae bacterium]